MSSRLEEDLLTIRTGSAPLSTTSKFFESKLPSTTAAFPFSKFPSTTAVSSSKWPASEGITSSGYRFTGPESTKSQPAATSFIDPSKRKGSKKSKPTAATAAATAAATPIAATIIGSKRSRANVNVTRRANKTASKRQLVSPSNNAPPPDTITQKDIQLALRAAKKAAKQADIERKAANAAKERESERKKSEWILNQMKEKHPDLLEFAKGGPALKRSEYRRALEAVTKTYVDPNTFTFKNNNNGSNESAGENGESAGDISTLFAKVKALGGRDGKKKATKRAVYELEKSVIAQCKGGFGIDQKTGKLDYSRFVCWLCGFPIAGITNKYKVKEDGTTPAPASDYSLFASMVEKTGWPNARKGAIQSFMAGTTIDFEKGKVNGETLPLVTCEHVLPIKLTPWMAFLWHKMQGSLTKDVRKRQYLAYEWSCRFCNYIKNHRHFITLNKHFKNAYGTEVNYDKIKSVLERMYTNKHGKSGVKITFGNGVTKQYPNHVQAQLGILEEFYKAQGDNHSKATIKAYWIEKMTKAIGQRQQKNIDQIKQDEHIDFSALKPDIMASLDPNVQDIIRLSQTDAAASIAAGKDPRQLKIRTIAYILEKKHNYTQEQIMTAIKPIPGVGLNHLVRSIKEGQLLDLTDSLEEQLDNEPEVCEVSAAGLPASSACDAYFTKISELSTDLGEDLGDAEFVKDFLPVDALEDAEEVNQRVLNVAEEGKDTYLEPTQEDAIEEVARAAFLPIVEENEDENENNNNSVTTRAPKKGAPVKRVPSAAAFASITTALTGIAAIAKKTASAIAKTGPPILKQAAKELAATATEAEYKATAAASTFAERSEARPSKPLKKSKISKKTGRSTFGGSRRTKTRTLKKRRSNR